MRVRNVHRRRLPAPPERLSPLIDRLASHDDRLWPLRTWPPMRLDPGLRVGAAGGHGPIGYGVEAVVPGRSATFRFTRPRGFRGTHRFSLEPAEDGGSLLTHAIEMQVGGAALFQWVLVLRPLHDALIEDALDRAEEFAGTVPRRRTWSPWVRLLRKLLSKKKRR